MIQRACTFIPAAVLLAGWLTRPGHAQALPTADQQLQFSTFAGVTGVYTGFGSGRNLDLTAGADLTWHGRLPVAPALEIRGSFPINKGKVDSQRNLLGGVRLGGAYKRLRPYGDLLFGRGQINYTPPQLDARRTVFYVQSVSNVLSAGGGIDLLLTSRLALKADAQLQRYASPVPASGHITAKPLTLALVYRFNVNSLPRAPKH